MKRHANNGLFFSSIILLLSVTALLGPGALPEKILPDKKETATPHVGVRTAGEPSPAKTSSPSPKRSAAVEAIPLSIAVTAASNVGKASIKADPEIPKEHSVTAIESLSNQLSENLLRYGHVQVSGNYRLKTTQILALAGLSNSPWIWDVSPQEMEARLRSLPWIEQVKFDFSLYPLALSLNVQEAEPWLIAEYEDHSWLVSRSANLIQPLDSIRSAELILETTELPRVDGLDAHPDMANYLASANARFIYAMKLIKLLQAAGTIPFSVERYTLLPAGGIQLTPERNSNLPSVLVSAETFEQAEQSVSRLKVILADLERRGEQVRRIDLRFRNQAVVE